MIHLPFYMQNYVLLFKFCLSHLEICTNAFFLQVFFQFHIKLCKNTSFSSDFVFAFMKMYIGFIFHSLPVCAEILKMRLFLYIFLSYRNLQKCFIFFSSFILSDVAFLNRDMQKCLFFFRFCILQIKIYSKMLHILVFAILYRYMKKILIFFS